MVLVIVYVFSKLQEFVRASPGEVLSVVDGIRHVIRGVNEPILSEYSSFELGSFFFWFGSSSSSNSGRAYILCSSSARQGEIPVRDRTRV
jgi:hypothetical protein